MAIPTDHLMLWTEIYNGIPGKPRTKCVEAGWCCLPKNTPLLEATQRVAKHFHEGGYPANKFCVLSYTMDRTAGFKTTQRILGIFG